MKNIFSNLIAVTVFLRMCELSAEPITALPIAVAIGACAGRVYEQMFDGAKKQRAPQKKGTALKKQFNIDYTTTRGVCQ